LASLQKIVDGYIEVPYLSNRFAEEGIDVIINEEGKLIGLEPQMVIMQKETYKLLDLVMGNCIFASHDEEGNTTGLTDKQIKIIKEELKHELLLPSTMSMVKVLFM
jgi:hypothetical protein